MKILSWNVRGLNSWKKCALVKRLLQQHNPNIVLLQETKLDATGSLIKSIWSSAFTGWSALDAIDTSGGLLILWHLPDFTVHEVIHGLYIMYLSTFPWLMVSLFDFRLFMVHLMGYITMMIGRNLMTWLVWVVIIGLLEAILM